MTTRTLVVMRHARAEQYAESDRARPLTDRGRADAGQAGRHLQELGLRPDHVLVSAARRTVQTWEQVHAVVGGEPVEEVSDALYAASPRSVVEFLRLVPADARVVLVVGHNPTMEQLVHDLDDREGDPAVLAGLLAGFPTCGLAVFEVDAGWEELDGGRLVAFHTARS